MAGISKERKTLIRQNQKDVVSRLRPGDLVKIHRESEFFTHWAVYVGKKYVVHIQVEYGGQSIFNATVSRGRQRAEFVRHFPSDNRKSFRYQDGTRAICYPDGNYTIFFRDFTHSRQYQKGEESPVYPRPNYYRAPKMRQEDEPPSGRHIWQKNKCKVVKENIYDVAKDDKIELGNDWDRKERPLDPEEIVERACNLVGQNSLKYHALYFNCEHFARWCRYGQQSSDQSMKIAAGLTIGPIVGGFLLGGPVGATLAGVVSLGALIKNVWSEMLSE